MEVEYASVRVVLMLILLFGVDADGEVGVAVPNPPQVTVAVSLFKTAVAVNKLDP